jgi:phosphohistidine phosphatase
MSGTITVCLMRHAKSDWDDPALSDHDRPLNARGRRDAPRMARWLAGRGFLPEVILGSTAVRVRQTIEGLLSVWTHDPLVLFSQSLYLASASTLREHLVCEAVGRDGRRPRAVMLIAHNPGIESLTSQWVGVPTRMPTAAVAIFRCEAFRPDDLAGPRVRDVIEVARPKEIVLDGESGAAVDGDGDDDETDRHSRRRDRR